MSLDQGLEVGAEAPSFELPEVEGGTVALEEALGNPVIPVFYRGSWRNWCSRQLGDLGDRYEEVEASGVRLVAISSESLEVVWRYVGERASDRPKLEGVLGRLP